MKTNYIRTISAFMMLAIVIIIQSTSVFAQQGKHPHEQSETKSGSNHEKIEAQKIAFITQQVELTSAEAKIFWPVYNEYEAKRHEMRKKYKNTDDFQKPDFNTLTEKEASQILDNQLVEAQKLMDLRKEYVNKYRAILPSVKVLKLQEAERDFQKMLIDKLRQNKTYPEKSK